jgi:hypothetical protein
VLRGRVRGRAEGAEQPQGGQPGPGHSGSRRCRSRRGAADGVATIDSVGAHPSSAGGCGSTGHDASRARGGQGCADGARRVAVARGGKSAGDPGGDGALCGAWAWSTRRQAGPRCAFARAFMALTHPAALADDEPCTPPQRRSAGPPDTDSDCLTDSSATRPAWPASAGRSPCASRSPRAPPWRTTARRWGPTRSARRRRAGQRGPPPDAPQHAPDPPAAPRADQGPVRHVPRRQGAPPRRSPPGSRRAALALPALRSPPAPARRRPAP